MEHKQQFKDAWVTSILRQLNSNDLSLMEKLGKIFDETFCDNTLSVYNSVYNTKHIVSAAKYYMTSMKNCIVNENGVLTYKHSFKSSKMYDVIDGGIKGRQVQKKKKQQLIKEGKYSEADDAGLFEYALKVLINGLYGLHLYPGSSFYNVTLGATCTAAARNLVAVAAVVIELLEGGYRNYQVQAHLKIIERTREVSKDINSKYNLPDVAVEDVLKVMLGDYYNNYYALSFLRKTLETETQETLNTLYIKNNIYAFLKLDKVSKIVSNVLDVFHKTGKPLVDPKKDEEYKDMMSELYNMSYELLYGFYYYDGDYDGKTGIYYDTLVDIVENIHRKKIVLMDTDSCVTTLQREVEFCIKEFSLDRTNTNLTNATIPMMIVWIYMGCLDNGLTNYVKDLGVEDDPSKNVKIEMEHMMSQLHITIAKKSYGFIPTITDFFMNENLKLKLKGVSIIKSNFNKEFCSIAEKILVNRIMEEPGGLEFDSIIRDIKTGTQKAIDIIRSDDFVLNKRTTLKIGSDDLPFSNHLMKSVNLWNALFSEDEIEFPGSFGVIVFDLTEDKLVDMERNFPREYNIFKEHSIRVSRFRKMASLFKKVMKIEGHTNLLMQQLRRLALSDSNAYSEDRFNTLKKIFSNLSSEEKAFIKTIKVKDEFSDEVFSNNTIVDNIQKLALPVGLNTVPEFIRYNNFNILDINASSEVEHVISPFTSTMGMMFTKNKSAQNSITSVLNTY